MRPLRLAEAVRVLALRHGAGRGASTAPAWWKACARCWITAYRRIVSGMRLRITHHTTTHRLRSSSDVFEELLSLLTPERLLHDPRATGEGVRVCVIDSGVERAVLEEKFRSAGQEIHPDRGRRLHRPSAPSRCPTTASRARRTAPRSPTSS